MLNIREGFQQWRGEKASQEQDYLNTALFLDEFMNSVDSLETIQNTLESQLQRFDQYNVRSMGLVAYARVFFEGMLRHLASIAETERSLLMRLCDLLNAYYENTTKDIKGSLVEIKDLLTTLLNLEHLRFVDKKCQKDLILGLYFILQSINLILANLNWKYKSLVSFVVNINVAQQTISQFLNTIQDKYQQFQLISLEPEAIEVPDPLKDIKTHLNAHYFHVLADPPTKQRQQSLEFRNVLAQLTVLHQEVGKISLGIRKVLELRCKKMELNAKIIAINTLLLAAQENDQRVSARLYFLDFIAEQEHLVQVLFEQCDQAKKELFAAKIIQLQNSKDNPNITHGILQKVSQVVSPLQFIYRSTTPQTVQNIISTTLPTTLDSSCKSELQELAKESLLLLQEQLQKKEQQCIVLNHRYFEPDRVTLKDKQTLSLWINKERSESLLVLQKANEALEETVQSTKNLYMKVKENLQVLHKLKHEGVVLQDFIERHNGILVKISNFLAQFFSFFKSDTAQMIDKAEYFKTKANSLANQYQRTVDQQMSQIEAQPHLTPEIKNHLKKQFLEEQKEEHLPRVKPNKHNVRVLMYNMSSFFAGVSVPVLNENNLAQKVNERIITPI